MDVATVLSGLNLSVVSVVGGGGKTTLTLQLANSLSTIGQRVLVTTTTKMYEPQIPQEVGAIVISGDRALDEVIAEVATCFDSVDGGNAIVFLAAERLHGPGRQKVGGIPTSWPARFLACCDNVLIEADGARHLPFKAPAAHEPCIADHSSAVLAVAGIDALGCPLDEEHVCRAEIVAGLTGSTMGDKVNTMCMARVMGDSTVWKTPSKATYAAIINKVDDEDALRTAREIFEMIQVTSNGTLDLGVICGCVDGHKGMAIECPVSALSE